MDFQKFPEGYSTGMYQGKKYGISKTTFNKGKSFKLYAEELGGSDFISMNYTSSGLGMGQNLRRCFFLYRSRGDCK